MTFENRKAEVVNAEIGRLREATTLVNSVMASLNLPAAIEDLSGEFAVSWTHVLPQHRESKEQRLCSGMSLPVSNDGTL